jgi:antitoxin CptB
VPAVSVLAASTMTSERHQTSRLVWRCRRGMRELDVLLSDWLMKRFPDSGEALQQDFAALLDCEDDLIWDWLTGRGHPEPRFAELVQCIREHAADRSTP